MKTNLKILAPLISSLALSLGCAPSARQEPVQAVFAIDVSCPIKARLIAYAGLIYQAQRSLAPGSKVSILIFGHSAQLIYSGSRILGRDTFNADIGKYLSEPPNALTQPGTHFERLFDSIARQVTKPCVIVIATDGGMEDHSKAVIKDLDQCFACLAKKHIEGISLVGVSPAFRMEWQAWLKPFGAVARVRGMQDAGDIATHPQAGGRS